jgi:hypothetical protein
MNFVVAFGIVCGVAAALLGITLVEEAVEKVYKHHGGNEKEKERIALGTEYRARYDSFSIDASNPPFPYFIGVWDTVRALGIPGSSGLVFWRHAFHNATLNARVPYARQALSIDENRQIFAPEIWDESEEFFETPVWHVDAARGPSTPSFDQLVGA